MISIKVDTNSVDKVFNNLNKDVNNLKPIVNSWGVRVKTIAANNIMSRAKHPTGRLASSLITFTKSNNSEIVSTVQSSLDYAYTIEEKYHYLEDAVNVVTPNIIQEIKAKLK